MHNNQKTPPVKAGPLTIYPFDENIYLNGKPLPLCNQERKLLRHLVLNPDKIILDSEVLIVLGHDPTNATGAHRKCIQRLRKKLEDAGLKYWLITIPNRGVMLETRLSD